MQTSSDAPIPGLPGGEGDAEARYQTLLNGVLHGVVFQDADGRIHSANPAAQRILGLSLAQMQGRDSVDARWQAIREDGSPFPGEAHPAMVALRTGQAVEGVVMGVFNPERAETRWISVSAAPLFRPGELRAHQVMTTFADITDKVRLGFVQVFLAKAHWLITGEDFFLALARFLAQHLGVDYVCIDRLVGEGLEAETLAIWVDGHFDDNQRYALKDTPCGEVVGKNVCCFPQGVRQQFPKDQVLQDMGAESYLGVTLWGTQGQPIGLIALIGRRPLADRALAESTLALAGARAAGELERREVEDALRRSRAEAHELSARLHSVLESPQGLVVFALDSGYRYTAFTRAHQEVMHRIWGANITLGMNMLDAILDPVDREKAKRHFDRALAGEYFVQVEDYGVPPNRTSYEDRYSPIRDGGGAISGLSVFVLDITERQRVEQDLRESEGRFRALFEGAPDAILLADPASRTIVDANQAACRLLGRQREAVLGMKQEALHPPQSEAHSVETFDRHIREATSEGFTRPLENRMIRPDGTEVPVEIVAQLVQVSGETRLMGVFRDITERKQAEEALRESEQRFRSLFQEVESVAVQSYGPDGITHYWNKASENLYGFTAQEAVGKSLLELIIPPELRAEVSAAMGRMGQTGQRIPASELSLLRKDGSRVSVYSSHTVVAVPGQPPELFCIDIDLTAFKRASEGLERSETELRRQNHLFSALLDILPVGVFMVEVPSGKPLVANGEAMKLLGRGVLPDASQSCLSEIFKAYTLGTHKPYPVDEMPVVLGMKGLVSRVDDMVVERPDGSTSLLEVFGSPVRDDQGNIWASLASFFDITQRKRAEEALREREELLRLSLQGADLGAWDWDLGSGQVTVNERWWEMLGYQSGELDSHMQHFDARVHPDDLVGVRAALEAHIRQETPAYESTHRLRHKDGRWIWVLDRGRVILRDGDGAALRMCGTHLDITESQGQASLEAARLRLTEFSLSHTLPELLQATVDEAAVFADSPIGFFHFVDDDETTINLAAWSTRTLQEFCTAKGFNRHYPLQQAGVWADCLRQREAVIHNDYQALPHRKGLPPGHAHVQREMVVPLFRGERIVALLGVGNKPEPYGAPDIRLVERLAEVAWVIIERKKAEEQQRQLQAQLQQAQKMESLGILAGGVAHDMNNVLGAILGWASASLETQPEGSTTYRAFDTISRAALRGGALVRSLLSFARQSPAEARELDMNAILREEVHLLERTTLAKVALELELASDLKPMRGDAGALTHALMNLCVNAVDAMPEGGTLTLRTRNAEPPWIEIQVEDTGEGMPTSVLTKALDPFFTTKGVGKGTGLGLSMVYSTVKAHQGEMAIESEPGWGTCVTLRFPACNAEVAPVEAAPAPPPQRRPEVLAVLLVDDDELIRSSIQALLEAMGHEATAVASGEAALEQMEAGYGPDVVILDMNMPGLGGAGTLLRLRALNATVPVLLATGRADQAALDLIAAHPQVTLLAKPFTMAQLKGCLEVLRPRPS